MTVELRSTVKATNHKISFLMIELCHKIDLDCIQYTQQKKNILMV